jgi:hypothetical protein
MLRLSRYCSRKRINLLLEQHQQQQLLLLRIVNLPDSVCMLVIVSYLQRFTSY